MDTKATVQSLMDAVQMGDFEKAKTTLSNDFKFSGPVPQPISGEEWMGMSAGLKAAFPDLNYRFKVDSVDGNTAHISGELSGTHNGELDLTSMHMGTIPATGKSFKAAHEHGKVTVRDGKVTAWAMEPTEGAGLMAILNQLGVKVPSMQ
jgi:hypothetical protein